MLFVPLSTDNVGSGFVRGRQLSSNIRTLLSIVLSPHMSQAGEMVIYF